MKSHPAGAELFHATGRTDGETDSPIDTTQLMVAVRSFKNDPKNGLTQTRKIEGRRKSSPVATFPQRSQMDDTVLIASTIHKELKGLGLLFVTLFSEI